MTFSSVTFRESVGAIDADRQYSLWLRATTGLPLAWPSSLANARSLAARAAQHPGSRLYAEDQNGDLIGYIGTHPPFDWGDMGLTVPFGFPWTWPRNGALAAELYKRMHAAVTQVYAADPPRTLIQRFRSTWTEQHTFVRARGWTERFRKPILTRRIALRKRDGAPRLRALSSSGTPDYACLSAHADTDPLLASRPSASTLSERAAAGWFSMERCWEVEGLGAFALDIRDGWAEVEVFYAHPDHAAELLDLMDIAARAHGAEGLYFILAETEAGRRGQLESAGFTATDADVYVGLTL
jgi:hypothetical protein